MSGCVAQLCFCALLQYLRPLRMLMCRLPLITVQSWRDWAASTESMIFSPHTLSHGPSQALQYVLESDRQWESYMIHNGHWQWFLHETARFRFWTWNYQPLRPPGASMQVLSHNSPVGCSARVPWRAFTHTPSVVDDEDFVLLIYEFKASLCTDAAPAFKLVGSRRAVRHTTSFVVVMHTSGARCITIRNRAAAETLRVAALAICGAHLSFTPLRTLC